MQEASTSGELQLVDWDAAFVGEAVDERGEAALTFARKNTTSVFSCSYNADNFEVVIDKARYAAEGVGEALERFHGAKILFDATTLGFSEIFLLCRGLRQLNHCRVSITYVEPRDYKKSRGRTELIRRREFDLSDEVPGYRAIPGAISMLSEHRRSRVVFFLGYEERRLDRALEDFALQPSKCSVVFGVPAFRPGWEMDSFANNVRVMIERDVRGNIYYCGAESPGGAMEVLSAIKRELHADEKLLVAPIGTKPNGVGVALFAAEDEKIGLLYDHPRRKSKRSTDQGSWHLYEALFSGNR